MPTNDPYGFFPFGQTFMEAEVSPAMQPRFQSRYLAASGVGVTPGNPAEYQSQPQKWGAECRIYFNDHAVAAALAVAGIHVEIGRPYRKDYQYRVNNNELWWELVEQYGFRLGLN